jgi:anti-sigma-K factor RskA
MKVRVLAGIAVGAAAGWLLRAERERVAIVLHQARERSRAAAQVLVHGSQPPASAPVSIPEPEPQPEPQPEPLFEPSPQPELDVVVAAAPTPVAPPVPAPAGERRRRLAVASAIAAILSAFVAAGAASWQQWGDGTKEATPTESANRSSTTSSLVSQPGATRLPLVRSSGKLSVVVGRSDRAVLIGSVGPAPTAKEYEVWVIRAGEPRRAGLFAGGPGQVVIALTRDLPPGATVAVTLEPRGGSDAPTSKPLFHATRSLPRAVLAILAQRDALKLPLAPSDGRLSVLVGRQNRAILISSNLAPAPAGKQYEVWVIRGKHVASAGLFDAGSGRDVIGLTRPVPAGAIVAVTLERAGGVKAPTQKPRFAATRS